MKEKLRKISIESIRLSGNNPRIIDEKDPDFLELIKSISAIGVIVPIHIRSDPQLENAYELLAGERRLKASQKAGLADIPALDHGDISDEAAFEITFAENFARKDLSVLEHGKAVGILLSKYKDDYAAVASRLNKPERWVRLHACIDNNLIVEWRKATAKDGQYADYTATHLGLIARFPAETQKAIYSKLNYNWAQNFNVKELEKRLADMLRLLSKAKFDTAACQKCQKRSGVQPQLWSDEASEKIGKDDKCLDAACWEKKEIAAAKKNVKIKREKYPGLIGISKQYYLDDGKRLRKIYGKILTKGDYETCKKTDKNSIPAILVDGKGKGNIHYVKLSAQGERRDKSNKPSTLKQLREALETKRWAETAERIIGKIKELRFDKLISDDLLGNVFRLNILIAMCGINPAFYGQSGKKAFKEISASKDVSEAIKKLSCFLWQEISSDLEFVADTSGDDESRKECKSLAELFEFDINAEYKAICKEPEFAEPSEWANLKANGTPKKSKSKKSKKSTPKSAIGRDRAENEAVKNRKCRICGCTDDNACIDGLGEPCHWVEPDLCSLCHENLIITDKGKNHGRKTESGKKRKARAKGSEEKTK